MSAAKFARLFLRVVGAERREKTGDFGGEGGGGGGGGEKIPTPAYPSIPASLSPPLSFSLAPSVARARARGEPTTCLSVCAGKTNLSAALLLMQTWKSNIGLLLAASPTIVWLPRKRRTKVSGAMIWWCSSALGGWDLRCGSAGVGK